jgi:predicted DNA-binding transcriptional regulator YafY
MRADRLLSILLLLQARGRMTAATLAAEFEVSERTIHRDIDALSAAGVPVCGQPGPGGGFGLLDPYRTQLTGLNADEVRALFMLSIPAPLARLGIDEHLRTALRKLAAALPEARRDDERRVRERFHLDATWWQEADEPVPFMGILHDAVWNDRRLLVTHRPPFAAEMVALIDPYGLVAKAGVWHLVFGRGGRARAQRVSAFTDVRDAGETFARPPAFDLVAFWSDWCREQESELGRYRVRVRVSPAAMSELRRRVGARVGGASSAGPGEREDWLCPHLTFESMEQAREQILGLGRGVEVLEPEALRLTVADYARQIVDLYGRTEPGAPDGGRA